MYQDHQVGPAKACGGRDETPRFPRWPEGGQEWDSQAILQQSCWVVELALSAWKPSSSARLVGVASG